MNIFSILENELKQKIAALGKDTDAFLATIKAHHQPLSEALKTGKLPAQMSEFALVHSILNGTAVRDVKKLKALSAHQWPVTLSDGSILGLEKYETLDPFWVYSFISWLEDIQPPAFPSNPPIVPIDDVTRLAIFGDWGGGNWHKNSVASIISGLICRQNPDYVIHLGDTYYAGSHHEIYDHLLRCWPAAKKGNFTLNGNHEMYHSAVPYFNLALKDDLFALQNGTSFFALENTHWIVVGLDTAFFADRKSLYMDSTLNDVQIQFLKKLATKNKSVIVLSHHNGIDVTGQNILSPLWNQVTDALGDTLKYWYWGHVHMGAVYKTGQQVQTRAVGHGVIPYGRSEALSDSDQVIWFEETPADDKNKPYVRVQNGFVVLELHDDRIRECFYGEDGTAHWTNN